MIQKVFLIIIAVAVLVAVSWLKGWWIPNRPDPDKYPIRGIDVSHHNGAINWSKVKQSGVQFAFIKATEGKDWVDVRFLNNWQESSKAGIIRGAYHFFSTTSSGEAQALNYISTVPRDPGMLPPVIDIEFAKARSRMTDEEFYRELGILDQALERHYGVEPIIYTTEEFRNNYFEGKEIKNLWAREILSRHIDDWAPNWMFWQYSSRGNVAGIKGRVDLNVYRKRLFDLEGILVR